MSSIRRLHQVMLDLETLGTSSNAVILSIGAVEFDLVTKELGERFYVNVDIQSCFNAGLKADGDTIMWWLKQDDAARAALTNSAAIHINMALGQFNAYLFHVTRSGGGNVCVWGNGCGFDNVILQNAHRKTGIGRAKVWPFRNDRDMRTLIHIAKLLGINPRNVPTATEIGIKHSAIDDAIRQAQVVMELYTAMRAQILP